MSAFQSLQLILKSFLSFFLTFNLVDVLLLFVFLFYSIEGYGLGFIGGVIDFLGFVLSFIIGLKYYALFGGVLVKIFSMPVGFANAIGFLALSFLVEIIVGGILKKIIVSSSGFKKIFYSNPRIVQVNNFFGVIPAILSSAVLITFFLTLIVALPFSPSLKSYVLSSKIGGFLVSNAQGIEKQLNGALGGVVNETLNFLTVEPKSNESVNLNFTTNKFSIDTKSEQQMFNMVNSERQTRGIATLIFDNALTEVGRKHCEDMFLRGYFSHYTPENLSPFDRMNAYGISFSFAGENLALAPNVVMAMQGLMNSTGHRENILSPNFGKVGIGVIDGGIYGEMFCQEFND